MLYAVTNGQEVAAPMAALYILNETPFWFSHEFIHVNLKAMLRKHANSVEVNVSQKFGESEQPRSIDISGENSLEQYRKRELAVENVAFIDIIEQYECTGIKTAATGMNSLAYKPLGYSRLDSAKILVICGDELPDVTSSLDRDQIDYYYTALLTLFKPHRENSLLNQNESPVAAYHSFLQLNHRDLSHRMMQFQEQCKDYYYAQRSEIQEKESAEENLLRTRAPPTTGWAPMADVNDRTSGSDDDFDEAIPHDFFDVATVMAVDTSTAKFSQDAANAVQNVPQLQTILKSTSDEYDFAERVNLGDGFSSDSYTSRIITSGSAAESDACEGTQRCISQFHEAPTHLERLHECFGPVPYRSVDAPPRWTPATLPEFPEIAMTSEAFQLNFWQHVVFEVTARHLLYAYSGDIADSLAEPIFPAGFNRNPYEIKPQLIGYLGGEAGTGKSTVVEALLAFARLWGREGSVETMAFTGVAAINIKGKTLHSARNLKLSGAEPNTAPTIEMKQKFRRVVLCVIDEISITDQSLLGGTDAVSRSMTRAPERIMGGKHTLLTGDLLQLPPIAGSPCFKVPPASANRLRHAGYGLYGGINFAVFLSKNMRARFDPEYTPILDDLCWGRLTDGQIERLNTRVQTQDTLEIGTPRERDIFYRPVVVCTNHLRCAINFSMVFGIARGRELPVYESLAVPCARSRHIVERLANVNDNLTDRIPMKLLFFIGMPVMITRKHPRRTSSQTG